MSQGSMPRRIPWTSWLAPLLIIEAYLNLSIAAFALGPWEYPISDYSRVVIYVLIAHLALAAGYCLRGRRASRGYTGTMTTDRLTALSSILSIAMVFPTSLLNTGHLVPDVLFGLLHPGEAYGLYQTLRVNTTPLAAYARMLAGPILALPLALTVFYWGTLSRRTRILGVGAILANMGLYLAMAVNQGIALPIMLVPLYLVAAYAAGRLKPSRRQIGIASLVSLLAAGAGLTFFTSSVAGREGSGISTGTFSLIGATADRQNVMTRHVSDEVAIGIFGLTSYIGQGYYGLSLAMDKPFIPMYGIGHSTFLYRQAARISGNASLEHLAYPERISDQDGWTVVQYFQTIYPWFASDVGFPGTILVVFVIGWTYAAAWAAVIQGENPYAVAFFGQLTIMLLYFPAVNAVLQGGEGVAAFWGLALLWTFTRRRFRLASPSGTTSGTPA